MPPLPQESSGPGAVDASLLVTVTMTRDVFGRAHTALDWVADRLEENGLADQAAVDREAARALRAGEHEPDRSGTTAGGYLCAGCGAFVPLADAVTVIHERDNRVWGFAYHPACVKDEDL